jgi:hypothetical protein
VKLVTSAPSSTPVVTGVANLSTVHSTNVLFAVDFDADERTGVSSGAKMVKTSIKSSLLEILVPVFKPPVGAGSKVFENAMIFKFY